MKPILFDEANLDLGPPSDMTEDECGRLPVLCDRVQCLSLWRPSLRERLSILIFGHVWLCIRSGETQPPVWLRGERQVF